MELNIESQKQEFLTICRASIQRKGLEDLLDWLCKADFFTAPASTHYHGGYAGGLCQHSIDVYQYAKRLTFLMDKAPSLLEHASIRIGKSYMFVNLKFCLSVPTAASQ